MKKSISLILCLLTALSATSVATGSAEARRAGGGGGVHRTSVHRTSVHRTTVVRPRPGQLPANRVGRVGVRPPGVVVVNPRRTWVRGGAVAAGAAIGFIAGASAVAIAGSPPQPGYCWYYTNSARTTGFWDLCP